MATAVDPVGSQMAPEALVSSKKLRLSKFPCVGIGQRESEPTIGNLSFQGLAVSEGLFPSFCFFPVIFAVHRFHLHLAGTGFTGLHHGFAASDVVGELVAGHLPFVAAAAAAPPVCVA